MASIKADTLPSHLKKGLAPLYVLHGEEMLLTLEASDLLRATAKNLGYDEREVLTVETHFDWSLLREAASSGSLFSSLKWLEIRIPSGKPGTEGGEALQSLAADLPPDTVILVILPKLDKTQLSSKWFLALDKVGICIENKAITRDKMPAWLAARLALQGQSLSAEASDFFVNLVEGNVLAAKQEVDKLAILEPQGQLDLAAIERAVTNVARFDVFKLSEAWMSGDRARIERMLAGLEAEGETPVLLIWSLAEDIRTLIKLAAGLKQGKSRQELERDLRLWGDKQTLFPAALKRIGAKNLMSALQCCAQIDRQIKGAESGNPWMTLRDLMQNYLLAAPAKG